MIFNILFWLVGYLFGFFTSLFVLHKYKVELGVDYYDPPHGSYYDDYDSNAKAYLTFSIVWPMFWIVMGIAGLWGLLTKLSELIGGSINKEKDE